MAAQHRDLDGMGLSELNGLRVSGICVAHNAHARIGGQHPAPAGGPACGVPSATITWPAWIL